MFSFVLVLLINFRVFATSATFLKDLEKKQKTYYFFTNHRHLTIYLKISATFSDTLQIENTNDVSIHFTIIHAVRKLAYDLSEVDVEKPIHAQPR